jgi:hypothetical protein
MLAKVNGQMREAEADPRDWAELSDAVYGP